MNLEIIHKRPSSPSTFPPVLFIHGAYADARCWDVYFLDYFTAKGYEVAAVSLRGHGKSEGHEDLWSFTLADYAADVISAMEVFDTPPILVGHSMGGLVAQNVISDSRVDCPAMILMASSPPEGLIRTAPIMCFKYPVLCQKIHLANMLPRGLWHLILSPEEIRKIFFSDHTEIKSVLRYLDKIQNESFFAQIDMMFFNAFKWRFTKIPTVVIGGENDIIIPPDFIRITAAIYNGDSVLLPEMGHTMMLSDKWQVAADSILSWLACQSLHK